MNGILTTPELKKPHPSRLVGGAQMRNRLASHPCVGDENSGGIFQEQGVPATHQAPQPRFSVPVKSVPITSGCKNQWAMSREEKPLEPQAVTLKNPTHDITQTHSL